MATKKKQIQLVITNDSTEHKTNQDKKPDKTSDVKAKCEMNGHILSAETESENGHAYEHSNGCNSVPQSPSKEGSQAAINTSSPGESLKTDSSSSVEVLNTALKKIELANASKDECDRSKKKDTASELQATQRDLSEQITYVQYESELQMPDIMRLIQKDLSEPYSIYTYRYFIHNWPMLCFLVSFTLQACFSMIIHMCLEGYVWRQMRRSHCL